MRVPTLIFVAPLAFFTASSSSAADTGSYVACDNRLRCVVAPCPSTTVRDLAAGRNMKGVYPDIGALSAADQQRLREADALYFSTLVLQGRIEVRDKTIMGRKHSLSTLVVTGIGGKAKPSERRHCPKKG